MKTDCAVCHVDFGRTLAQTEAVDRSLTEAVLSTARSEFADHAKLALSRSSDARLCELCHNRLKEK